MNTLTLGKKITMKKKYDVIVCGGGVAGVAAAVTAAKEGFSTLLLEKSSEYGLSELQAERLIKKYRSE